MLPSAACYAAYFHLRGKKLEAVKRITTVATCFRNEREYRGLQRLRSFTMREIICIGPAEAVKAHLTWARDTWAEGRCEAERFIDVGDKIVVFIHVRVKLKTETEWREGRHASVYTFRNGLATEMRIFDDEQEALEWAGAKASEAG